MLHPKHALAIDTCGFFTNAECLSDERWHKVCKRGAFRYRYGRSETTRVGALTNARLASEHHAVLQRLRRLQPVGVDVRVVNVQADEMTQPMWHEQAVQIEGKSAFGAASHEPSRHEVAQQEHRRVAVYFIIF